MTDPESRASAAAARPADTEFHRVALAISHPIQYHAPLYRHLAADGRFDLKVFYMSDRGAREFYDPFSATWVRYDNPLLEGYDHVFLGRGAARGPLAETREFARFSLASALLAFAPEGVCFHGYANPAFWPAIRTCRRHGVATFLRGENEDVLPRPAWRRLAREAFLKVLLPRLDGVLYIGERNREFFVRRGFPPERLFWVPYSVDNAYFGASESELAAVRAAVRGALGVPEDTRLFVYTHKLRDGMFPEDAVAGFQAAHEHGPLPAALVVCGGGPLLDRVADLARRGPGRVHLAGHVAQSELRRHMLAADVMLNTAAEPWGCSVNEGLASGLAMLCSDQVVGWPDMVRDANGHVFPHGDIAVLSGLIRRLALLPGPDIERMKAASLDLSRRLSFESCADGLAEALRAGPRTALVARRPA